MKTSILLVLTALLATAAASRAAIPETMSYQGVLRDGNGALVSDGDYQLTFRLYTQAAGGVSIWTETQDLAVSGGVFNALLGSVDSLGALAFDTQYWLGVSVGGDPELTPRTPLASAPYALASRSLPYPVVSSLDGVVNDQGNIDLIAGANITITSDDGANTVTIAANAGPAGIGGSGAPNYLTKFTGTTEVGTSIVYENGNSLIIEDNPPAGSPATKDGKDPVRDRAPTRVEASGTDTWSLYGQVYNSESDGVAGVYGMRLSSKDGDGYGLGHTNTGVTGYTDWGNPYAFGVAGYTYGDYANNGGVIGSNRNGDIWGALGYRDNDSNWWGVYTEDSALVNGLTLPPGAGEGKVLTSDANGNASWQNPAATAEILATINVGSTTPILSTITQYSNCQVTLTVPGPGFITVTTNVWVKIGHVSGTADNCYITNSASPSSMGTSYTWAVIDVPSAWPSESTIDYSRTCTSTFPVAAGGTYTYWLLGYMGSGVGSDLFWFAQMTGIYHPASGAAVAAAEAANAMIVEKGIGD